MRKFIAIGIVLLLAIGLIVDRGLDTEAAVTTEAASSVDASGQLAALGPVALITNTYTLNVAAPCLTLLGTSVYFASFTAETLGASGTIDAVFGDPLTLGGAVSVGATAGSVSVLGSFPGDCGVAAATISGTIDDGGVTHFYVATIVTVAPPPPIVP